MPVGDLCVGLDKGSEHEPTRCVVTVRPGQTKLMLRIERWKELRRKGWVTAYTRVHFISPQTAWLEARREGVDLLARRRGQLFTNVRDISGRVGVVEDDTVVWIGAENLDHMLGHISLHGAR